MDRQVTLSDDERRMITVAIGLRCLDDLIQHGVNDATVLEAEEARDQFEQEFQELYERVDQDALREKMRT